MFPRFPRSVSTSEKPFMTQQEVKTAIIDIKKRKHESVLRFLCSRRFNKTCTETAELIKQIDMLTEDAKYGEIAKYILRHCLKCRTHEIRVVNSPKVVHFENLRFVNKEISLREQLMRKIIATKIKNDPQGFLFSKYVIQKLRYSEKMCSHRDYLHLDDGHFKELMVYTFGLSDLRRFCNMYGETPPKSHIQKRLINAIKKRIGNNVVHTENGSTHYHVEDIPMVVRNNLIHHHDRTGDCVNADGTGKGSLYKLACFLPSLQCKLCAKLAYTSAEREEICKLFWDIRMAEPIRIDRVQRNEANKPEANKPAEQMPVEVVKPQPNTVQRTPDRKFPSAGYPRAPRRFRSRQVFTEVADVMIHSLDCQTPRRSMCSLGLKPEVLRIIKDAGIDAVRALLANSKKCNISFRKRGRLYEVLKKSIPCRGPEDIQFILAHLDDDVIREEFTKTQYKSYCEPNFVGSLGLSPDLFDSSPLYFKVSVFLYFHAAI